MPTNAGARAALFVDSDNAFGSSSGDMDDAYALAALFCAGAPIEAISSCRGNTSEAQAFASDAQLAGLLGWRGPLLHASEARERLRTFRGRIVALGPLTNVVDAREAAEVIVVGGNLTSRGAWPPWWPFEFNLTKDRTAARAVFESQLPLTIFPLDVARTLWIERGHVDALGGAVGALLKNRSERWFTHLRRVRLTRRFPVYDLAAALYAIEDRGFTWIHTTATMNRLTALRFGRGTRPVKVCVGLDRVALWERFAGYVRMHESRMI